MKFLLFSAWSGEGERTGQPPKMAAVSRGRGAEAEAREAAVFPGPGLYGLGLTCDLVYEQDGVRGDSCSLETTRGQNYRKALPSLDPGRPPHPHPGSENSPAGFMIRNSQESWHSRRLRLYFQRGFYRSAFWSKGPTSGTVLSYTRGNLYNMGRTDCMFLPLLYHQRYIFSL